MKRPIGFFDSIRQLQALTATQRLVRLAQITSLASARVALVGSAGDILAPF